MATTPLINGTALQKIKWINTYIHRVPLKEATRYVIPLSEEYNVVLYEDGSWWIEACPEYSDDGDDYDSSQD